MVSTRPTRFRTTLFAPAVLGLSLAVACDAPDGDRMGGMGPDGVGGKADDQDEEEEAVDAVDGAIQRFALLTYPLVQIACRGQVTAHRNNCAAGVDDDENMDGIRDGGKWPTTIYDADGVRRVENGVRHSEEMCGCQYQRSHGLCEDLDVELLYLIYKDIYTYYTSEFLVDLLVDLVDGEDEREQAEEDLWDFDPFDDWEEEEEPEIPFESNRRIDMLSVVSVAADFVADGEFTDPPDVCECRFDHKPGFEASYRCGEALPFCQVGVCTECRTNGECAPQEGGAASVCELGTCIAAP